MKLRRSKLGSPKMDQGLGYSDISLKGEASHNISRG